MAQAKAMVERFGGGIPAHEARLTIRAGKHRGHTAGLAPGYVQGNLCILPADYATEFAAFCQRNPKPCPLIGMSAPGDPRIPTLARDLDIRTDVPRYRVFRQGELADEPVLAEGRVELLRYVYEQSLCVDYHRYGNLGARAAEKRSRVA